MGSTASSSSSSQDSAGESTLSAGDVTTKKYVGQYKRPTHLTTPAISLLDSPYIEGLINPLLDDRGRYVSFSNRVIVCWYRRICKEFEKELLVSETIEEDENDDEDQESDSSSLISIEECEKDDSNNNDDAYEYGSVRRSFPILPSEIESLMSSFCAPAAELVPRDCSLSQLLKGGVKWVGRDVLRLCHAIEDCNQLELSLLLEMLIDETSKFSSSSKNHPKGSSLKALDLAKNPSPFSKDPFVGLSFVQTLFGLKIIQRRKEKRYYSAEFLAKQQLKSAKGTTTSVMSMSGSEETEVYGSPDDIDDLKDGNEMAVATKARMNQEWVVTLVSEDVVIAPMLGNLQSLWLDSNRMDYWQMTTLMHALLQWPNLENLSILNLSGNPIGDVGLAMVISTVILDEASKLSKNQSQSRSFRGLTKLYLSNIGATDTGIQYLSELLLNEARKPISMDQSLSVVMNCHPGISDCSVHCLEHLLLNCAMDIRGQMMFSIGVCNVSLKFDAYLSRIYHEMGAEYSDEGKEQYLTVKKGLQF